MTTNMNFGSEWMRGNLPRQSTQNGHDFVSSDNIESLLPFNESQQQQQQQQQDSPFKYSKEFMLGLYKPSLQLPSDFTQHEHATIDESIAPLAFEELSEWEKKLLAGSVHPESTSRKSSRYRGNDLYSGSPMQSPSNENGPITPGGSRLGARKGRTGDYFGKDHSLKRGESDLLKRHDQGDDGKKETGWPLNEPFAGNGLGDTSSVFKSDPLFGSDDLGGLSPAKKPEETKWYYRDPSGQVQGPFDAQVMQDWYKGGFFAPTLMIKREEDPVFEPLMVLIQKVGNDDQPFLISRPTRPAILSNDLFGSTEPGTNLFRGGPDLQSKYSPFGVSTPSANATTPGGSVMDNFLGSGLSSNPLYQSPYSSYGNQLLRDNRWNATPDTQSTQSPSWLNSKPNDLFNTPASPLGQSLFMPQQQPVINPVFGSNMNSPSIFDFQRPITESLDQHQSYSYLMQQQQQQQQQHQFAQNQLQQQAQQQQQVQQQQQQQAQQQQQQQAQQQQQQQQIQQHEQHPSALYQQEQQESQSSPSDVSSSQQQQQNALKNAPFENITANAVGSNHASPVIKPNILTSGWGSAPGTPLGNEAPSSPWGSIVSTAIPAKISEELQSKAPGTQSPRAPLSPKKAIEKPVKTTKTIVESFAKIQLEEEEKQAAALAAANAARNFIDNESDKMTKMPVEEVQQPVKTTKVVPTVNKPVVSLREIQEEEERIANEKKKAKQAKQAAALAVAASVSSSWVSNDVVPSSGGAVWSQPSHKPLSLREIQEMEAKQAAEAKKVSAAQHLAHQEQLANTTPSTLSWGVVVPKNKPSPSPVASSTSSSSSSAAPWTAPSGPKKTLREIQLEEELAMKKKNAKAVKSAAAVVSAATHVSTPTATKTYAVSSSPAAGGGWTTVTSARVTKPTPVVAPAPVVATPPAPVQRVPVKAPVRAPVRPSGPSPDFRRWCKKALRDLNSGVNQEEIIQMLISFPVDSSSAEIIEDVVYANSLRIDGKRFAQEFMKRRKADIAGRLDIVTEGLDEDEDEDDFKVVVTKKNKKKTNA